MGKKMDERLRRGFRIGPFEVEPLAGRITGPGGARHVQPKVMDVLLFLAQHGGELVERDTLLEQVWRRVTTEEVLTRCISELRRALGDDRGSPKYIQTVPKRGYRLVEPVALTEPETVPPSPEAAANDGPAAAAAGAEPAVAAAGVEPAAATPPLPTAAMASVAVLPFDNHSVDQKYSFMGDAFATELHTTLASVDRLRVASRRSSFLFKDRNLDIRDIGRELDVDYVISGSVRFDGAHLHVVAELNDARTGTQLWAQSYDRNSGDLLAVEKDIAGAIVGSFTTQHLRAETASAKHASTSSLDAWGLVQKARAFVLDYTPAGFEEAIEPLRRAIELDEEYPAAHAMLASLLIERLVNGASADPKRDEASAAEAAGKALALAPQDPFILKMVSLVWAYQGDHRRAMSCLSKAVEYAPFDFGAWGYMGWPMTASCDREELTRLRAILDRLLAAEPRHPGVAFWHYHRSVADACEGLFESALASAQAAVELRPSLTLAWLQYANVLGHLGQADRARAAVQRCLTINPAMTPAHYASLVQRMSRDDRLLENRLGGLRAIGALKP
jgi:adenylate cyclase